jgi:twinkle protein
MAETLRSDSMDFAAYMRETEPQQKVRPAGEYIQDLIDDLGTERHESKAYLPWDKSHALFQFRPGEVTLWGGVNGAGKSLVTGLAALSLCTQGERVCIASFEMKPRKTLERMTRQFSGQAAPMPHEMADVAVIAAFKDTYEQFRDWTTKQLWLYDQQGTVETQTLLGVLRYCAKELKITHFFIDSLMKCVKGEDDYNGQKAFVDEVTAIARDYGMHIHLVHHIRKLANEEAQPDKMDVKGSGSITDQVDNLLLVWRNKKKERDKQAGKMVSLSEPDALLICDKQRNGEWEGRLQLWYEKDSQQFVGAAGAAALNFYSGFPHRAGA